MIGDGGFVATVHVFFRRRPETMDSFSNSFIEFGKLLRSEQEQRNSKDDQQMCGLSQSFEHKFLLLGYKTSRSAYREATNSGTPARLSYSSSFSFTDAAATFSSRCSTELVPGMGSMIGDRRRSQASATCFVVA